MKNELNQVRQEKKAFIYDESFSIIPNSFLELIHTLSKSTIDICLKLFKYFSSETGRKKQFKVLSLNEIRSNSNLSRSSVLRAVETIIELDIFLVYDNETFKEKTYGFYINNKENRALFERLDSNESKLELDKNFREVENKLIAFDYSKKINSDSNLNKSISEMNTSVSKKNTCVSNLNKCCSKMNTIENTESIINSDFKAIPKISQEYSYKENNIKEHYIQEQEKTVCDGFKNLNEKVLTQQETLLLSFGVLKDKVSEFANTPIQFIEESIELVKNKPDVLIENRPRYLLGVLRKKAFNEKESAIAVTSAPKKVSATHDVESKIINFFFENKLLSIKNSVTALDESLALLITHRDNLDLLESFKGLGVSKDDLKSIFASRAGFPSGTGDKIRQLLAGY